MKTSDLKKFILKYPKDNFERKISSSSKAIPEIIGNMDTRQWTTCYQINLQNPDIIRTDAIFTGGERSSYRGL